MIETLFILPFISGLISFSLPAKIRKTLLLPSAIFHLALTVYCFLYRPEATFSEYFKISNEGSIILFLTSFLFLFTAIYSGFYLIKAQKAESRSFYGSMLIFLAAMSMVCVSDNLIVLWIAIEMTTLASAPLILIQDTKHSFEATWKYIIICSVGIALSLLGSFLITLSMDIAGESGSLSFTNLETIATKLDRDWLIAGFIFIFVGYGTKMGLAPMHTWLPDAHSEAISPASALLSGALLNCAFLGVFKTHKLLMAAGAGDFSQRVLIIAGLLSMLVAAIFILKQNDYKRLLAYSSIENMGIIAFGIGVGGLASYGAILHLIHHSLIKSSLFLTSGNILLSYGLKDIKRVKNLINLVPRTFFLFFAGFAGISGFPPFGIFFSLLLIIFGVLKAGYYISGGIFVVLLILTFAGMANYVMKMSFEKTGLKVVPVENNLILWPQYCLLSTSLALTIWMPEFLYQTIINSLVDFSGL